MKIRKSVWARKMHTAKVRHGYIQWAIPSTIRRARRNYSCDDCGATISKDEFYGAAHHNRFCRNCITAEEPELIFTCTDRQGHKKMIYIYEKLREARDIQNTIRSHFGIEVERIGTALRIEPDVYRELIETTYAPPARVVVTAWEARK